MMATIFHMQSNGQIVAGVVKSKVMYYCKLENDPNSFIIVLEGPYVISNHYDSPMQCDRNFEDFDKYMREKDE